MTPRRRRYDRIGPFSWVRRAWLHIFPRVPEGSGAHNHADGGTPYDVWRPRAGLFTNTVYCTGALSGCEGSTVVMAPAPTYRAAIEAAARKGWSIIEDAPLCEWCAEAYRDPETGRAAAEEGRANKRRICACGRSLASAAGICAACGGALPPLPYHFSDLS